MRKALLICVILGVAISLTCAKKVVTPASDKLLWSSEKTRPDWTYKEPSVTGDVQFFVGMSHKYADEKSARDDAERDARIRVISYMETAARETFERIVAEFGLASEVFNPSNAVSGYTELLSQSMIQNSKIIQIYIERWESVKTNEVYYIAFAKLELPDEKAIDSFKNYSNQKKEEWKMTEEQFNRVNKAFEERWEAKKRERELMQEKMEK